MLKFGKKIKTGFDFPQAANGFLEFEPSSKSLISVALDF
jgi:hypothetical protein